MGRVGAALARAGWSGVARTRRTGFAGAARSIGVVVALEKAWSELVGEHAEDCEAHA